MVNDHDLMYYGRPWLSSWSNMAIFTRAYSEIKFCLNPVGCKIIPPVHPTPNIACPGFASNWDIESTVVVTQKSCNKMSEAMSCHFDDSQVKMCHHGVYWQYLLVLKPFVMWHWAFLTLVKSRKSCVINKACEISIHVFVVLLFIGTFFFFFFCKWRAIFSHLCKIYVCGTLHFSVLKHTFLPFLGENL